MDEQRGTPQRAAGGRRGMEDTVHPDQAETVSPKQPFATSARREGDTREPTPGWPDPSYPYCSLATATRNGKRRRAPHSKASLRAADGLWPRGVTAIHWVASSLTGGCRTGCLTWSGSWLFRATAAALECGALHRSAIRSRTSPVGGVLRRQQTCSPLAPIPWPPELTTSPASAAQIRVHPARAYLPWFWGTPDHGSGVNWGPWR